MDEVALDPECVQSPHHDAVVQALGDWLAGFHWQVFATPTFRFPVGREQAHDAIDAWLRKLGPDVYAYVAYEEGNAGGRLHVHALIGGLVPRGVRGKGIPYLALALQRLQRAWHHEQHVEDVNGNVQVERYDPRRGAAWYVAKFPYDGEVFGNLKRHRHRHR